MLCIDDSVDGCISHENNGGLENIFLVHCTSEKNPPRSCSIGERYKCFLNWGLDFNSILKFQRKYYLNYNS